jgi:hypothetical protein
MVLGAASYSMVSMGSGLFVVLPLHQKVKSPQNFSAEVRLADQNLLANSRNLCI